MGRGGSLQRSCLREHLYGMKYLSISWESLKLVRVNRGTLCLFAFALFTVFFYVSFIGNGYYARSTEEPSLARWGADSTTYYSKGLERDFRSGLVETRGNYLGPMLLLFGLGFNGFLILIANVLMLSATYAIIARAAELDQKKFAVLLIFNPLVFGSLLLVNKEIFALFSTAIFFVYIRNGRKTLLWIALIIALLARWQQCLVFALFAVLQSRLNPVRGRPATSLLCVAGVISLLYPLIFHAFVGGVHAVGTYTSQLQGRAGVLLSAVNYLQDHYLFIVAVPLKALMILFGNIFRVVTFISDFPRYLAADVYNNFFILGHQLAVAVITVIAFLSRRANVKNPEIQLAILFLIVMALSEVIQYRYVFPVYLLLAIQTSKVAA
jgi:hypothetical protein